MPNINTSMQKLRMIKISNNNQQKIKRKIKPDKMMGQNNGFYLLLKKVNV